MKFKPRTLEKLADMVCGKEAESYFVYRSSKYLSKFFHDIDQKYTHDGTTRNLWVKERITELLEEPHSNERTPPDSFLRLIGRLMDKDDATNEGRERSGALDLLNSALSAEGFEAFYAEDHLCYLKFTGHSTPIGFQINPNRPLSSVEVERRDRLIEYLEKISEDGLIEEILIPLFRQLNFHRITASGHKDKALEYGKDIWMKYVLPTLHIIYFGIQVKKGKLDSSGLSRNGSSNISEIYNQVSMMIGHEIFDPELNRRVLVDHAFIVAGGEITKQARNWIGNKLDATKRCQILFMDRKDILNLYITTNMPLPTSALPSKITDDGIPF